MTPVLLIARDCISYWVNVWIAPIESELDAIKSALARRGIAPDEIDRHAHGESEYRGLRC